jgi:hypothetical protein
MGERSLLIACFGIGIALEAVLLQRRDWHPWKLMGCIALSLGGALPGKHETVYDPLLHVLLVFSMFAVVFALAFKEDILPAISEKRLLSYSLIFWFAFFSYFHHGTILQHTLVVIMSIPTAATILVACTRPRLSFTFKLILYTWLLCIVVGLGLFQFPFYQLRLFFLNRELPWVTPLESLSAGMAFLYLAANATYIFYLIPIPGKNESWAERMQHWHEFTDLMTQRFDDDVNTNRATVVILAAQCGILALDYFLHWMPSGLLINLLIVLPGVLLFFSRRSDPATQANQSPGAGREPWSRLGKTEGSD